MMPFYFTKPIFLLFWITIPFIWVMFEHSLRKTSPLGEKLLIGGLRSLLIIVLGLALADPRLVKNSDRVNLFFCLDMSDSIQQGVHKNAMDFMRKASNGMRGSDSAGLIIFGERASLETDLNKKFELTEIRSQVNRNLTNIYEALQVAVGKLPPDGKNRIVLFSDGKQNLNPATEMAHLAASMGIEIYSVPLTSWFGSNEVFIEKLETPPFVQLETPFEIRLVLVCREESRGEIILIKNGEVLTTEQVTLMPGKNLFQFADIVDKHGLYLYKSVVNAPDDGIFQNNEALSFTQGTQKASVLYVRSEKRQSRSLLGALKTQGITVTVKGAEELPRSINGLIDYGAIILDNVPAADLSLGVMENFERYVKDVGGGLIMIGGDQSFGAGDFMKTPVEKILPVFMDLPTTLEFPGLCLLLVIDKSSSMGEKNTSRSKLEAAKVAAFSAVELLNPIDKVGILAFDTDIQWVVRVTRAGNRKKIARQLSTLYGEGGTRLYPGLQEAALVLKDISAAKKHVIVLSDGLTDKADFRSLVQAMRKNDITVSTVAVGGGSDRDLMESIARWGGGRSYYTDDAESIPRIFVGETKIAATKVIIEKQLTPYPVKPGEATQGIPLNDLPAVQGIVATYPKPGAQVLIGTREGPLLAVWRFGLGKSAAFTSDLTGRWGKEWLAWEQFPTFASQMIKWARKSDPPRSYNVHISRKEGMGTFSVDVMDEGNRFVNNLDMTLNVLFPFREDKLVILDQTAPGRYSGLFPANEIGEYYLNLTGRGENGFSQSRVFGYGISHTEEFSTRGVDYDLLGTLAAVTGGKLIGLDEDLERIFQVDAGSRTRVGSPLWPHLTIAALLILILEVAVRKRQGIRKGRIILSKQRSRKNGARALIKSMKATRPK